MTRRALLVLAPFAVAAMVIAGVATAGIQGPPTVTPSHSSGWYQSSVTLTWTFDDDGAVVFADAGCNQTLIGESPRTNYTCSARDLFGGSTSVTVNIGVDLTNPNFPDPSDIGPLAATSPSGRVVNYALPSATDNLSTPTVVCSPAAGQFPVGTTQVSCTATDASGRSTSASFAVIISPFVPPNTPPVLSVPGSITAEATGPSGAPVSFSASASDTEDNPDPTPICTPPSGHTFPLGATQVSCTVRDSQGNIASGSFTITVRDTTPPVLTIPADLAIQSAKNLPATDPRIKAFLEGATATDIVDTSPDISTDAPETFPVGKTTVVFTAVDTSGNTSKKSAVLTVTPDPVGPQPTVDTTPPANVRNVRAIIGNLSVSLSWRLPPTDADRVKIFQSSTSARTGLGEQAGERETLIYEGKKTNLVVRGLTKDVHYRFVIVAYDKAGNRAAGIAVVAIAQEQALLAPANGEVLTGAPVIRWKPVPNASYYNVQVWHERAAGRAPLAATGLRKVLSAWPSKPSFKMKRAWRFGGKGYTLKPGRYILYVFPGMGPKAAGKYGKVHVLAEFTIVRR